LPINLFLRCVKENEIVFISFLSSPMECLSLVRGVRLHKATVMATGLVSALLLSATPAFAASTSSTRCPMGPTNTLTRTAKDYTSICTQSSRVRSVPVSSSNSKARNSRGVIRAMQPRQQDLAVKRTAPVARKSARIIKKEALARTALRTVRK